jgi:hypothetical protein
VDQIRFGVKKATIHFCRAPPCFEICMKSKLAQRFCERARVSSVYVDRGLSQFKRQDYNHAASALWRRKLLSSLEIAAICRCTAAVRCVLDRFKQLRHGTPDPQRESDKQKRGADPLLHHSTEIPSGRGCSNSWSSSELGQDVIKSNKLGVLRSVHERILGMYDTSSLYFRYEMPPPANPQLIAIGRMAKGK